MKSHLESMLYISQTERGYVGYISEYSRGKDRKRFKLMSKRTRKGDIFYVFYIQRPDAGKMLLHADVVYSKSTFEKRVRDLKIAYGIKEWAFVNLKEN